MIRVKGKCLNVEKHYIIQDKIYIIHTFTKRNAGYMPGIYKERWGWSSKTFP